MPDPVQNSNVQSLSAPTSSGKKFDPDAAMNAALNEQVGSIFELTDLSLSMSALSSTMETTAVANGTSTVALWSDLLSEQGLFCNSSNFNILKEWAQSPLPKTAANFDAFLKGLGGNAEATLFNSVYNDPNLTAADKDNFAQTIVNWYNSANGNLQEFQGNTSTVAQQLNSQTTNLQGWQSIDSALKPTQLEEAVEQLAAQIGQELSLFTDGLVNK